VTWHRIGADAETVAGNQRGGYTHTQISIAGPALILPTI
jgi:hypothetical protein